MALIPLPPGGVRGGLKESAGAPAACVGSLSRSARLLDEETLLIVVCQDTISVQDTLYDVIIPSVDCRFVDHFGFSQQRGRGSTDWGYVPDAIRYGNALTCVPFDTKNFRGLRRLAQQYVGRISRHAA